MFHQQNCYIEEVASKLQRSALTGSGTGYYERAASYSVRGNTSHGALRRAREILPANSLSHENLSLATFTICR